MEKRTLVLCGHGMSQNGKWFDNGASTGIKSERDFILDTAKYINKRKYGCYQRHSLPNKIKTVNGLTSIDQIIEIHYDIRPANGFTGVKVLYNKSKKLAESICHNMKVECKIHKVSNLYLLNASNKPTVIIEVGSL